MGHWPSGWSSTPGALLDLDPNGPCVFFGRIDDGDDDDDDEKTQMGI